MKILLDAGHGIDTAGKRSPVWSDGSQLFEYEFNRDIVKRIADELDEIGIEYVIICPEQLDISLSERVARANAVAQNYNSLFISVHANAGGGTGWEIFTSIGETKSDAYATVFAKEAMSKLPGWKIRKDTTDGDDDKEANFYVLKNTICPAVLTENFFMDSEKDCRFIMSEEGRNTIALLHVNAIKKIVFDD